MALIWRYRSSPGWACGRRMSAGLARELQIAGLLAGKIRPRIGRHGALVCTGLSPRVVSLTEDLDHDGLSCAVEVVDARDLEHRPACHHAAVQCARRGRSPRPHARVHERRAGRRPTSAPSSRDAERVTRRVGVGGRYRRPATASARSVSLARSPPGRGASGRGMPFFVLGDVLEGETRPRDEVAYGLRDEDLRRAGQDSCRGTPSKGEERGRTRLERVLAPGVRSGPC